MCYKILPKPHCFFLTKSPKKRHWLATLLSFSNNLSILQYLKKVPLKTLLFVQVELTELSTELEDLRVENNANLSVIDKLKVTQNILKIWSNGTSLCKLFIGYTKMSLSVALEIKNLIFMRAVHNCKFFQKCWLFILFPFA